MNFSVHGKKGGYYDSAGATLSSEQVELFAITLQEKLLNLYARDPIHQINWKIIWSQCLKMVGATFTDTQLDLFAGSFVRSAVANAGLFKNTRPFLKRMSERNIPMVLVSNVTGPSEAFSLALKDLGILHHFTRCVWSSDFKKRKPDSAIFHEAIASLGRDVKNILMIGDSEDADVNGAKIVGLTTLRINRSKKLAAPASAADHVASGWQMQMAVNGWLSQQVSDEE